MVSSKTNAVQMIRRLSDSTWCLLRIICRHVLHISLFPFTHFCSVCWLRSAHLISRYRPRAPIIAVTRNGQTARQAHLYRGIFPVLYNEQSNDVWAEDVDLRVNFAMDVGKRESMSGTPTLDMAWMMNLDHTCRLFCWLNGILYIQVLKFCQVDSAPVFLRQGSRILQARGCGHRSDRLASGFRLHQHHACCSSAVNITLLRCSSSLHSSRHSNRPTGPPSQIADERPVEHHHFNSVCLFLIYLQVCY